MSDNLFEQIIFGVYEILADILPGTIILGTFLLKFNIKYFELLPDGFSIIFVIFLAFIIGQVNHCIASVIEWQINKKKSRGYPSSKYLLEEDTTFPTYFKDKIRQNLNQDYGSPLDSSSQHLFDICYTFVTQNKISNRVMIFLNMYTFSRNMMVTVFLESFFLFIWAYIEYDYLICLIALLSLGSTYFFYRRFITYSTSFAKEVFRSYFVYKINKT